MARVAFLSLWLSLLLAEPSLAADNWPQFRGPDGQGHAQAAGLPIRWSETENIAWKATVPGRGWSSPVIQGRQIWMTTALDDGKSLRAVCLDRESGALVHNREVFRTENPLVVNAKNSHASPTPVVEPGRVYVNFGTLGTACLATDSGKVLWTNQELHLDHKEGPGSSLILYRNLLIFHCDGMDVQFVVALDKSSGRVVWKTDRSLPVHADPDQRKAYTTPLVINVVGRDLLVSPTSDRVFAYDPDDGREVWKVRYRGYSNVPRPVYGHGLVFICTGYNVPQLWAIRPDGRGDVTETHVAWKVTKQVSANPSPLLVGDELYFISDKGVGTCLDAVSGEECWTKRVGGQYSASPLFADGRIYFFSEDGASAVIRPGRDYELLAENQLDGSLMASPAVADDALFLRSDTHLYRIEQQ